QNNEIGPLNREGLSPSLTAHGHSGNQTNHDYGEQIFKTKDPVMDNQIDHQRGTNCPAYGTADITYHIIAKTGNLVGVPHQRNGCPGTGNAVTGHRMKRGFLSSGNGSTDYVKDNPQQDHNQ